VKNGKNGLYKNATQRTGTHTHRHTSVVRPAPRSQAATTMRTSWSRRMLASRPSRSRATEPRDFERGTKVTHTTLASRQPCACARELTRLPARPKRKPIAHAVAVCGAQKGGVHGGRALALASPPRPPGRTKTAWPSSSCLLHSRCLAMPLSPASHACTSSVDRPSPAASPVTHTLLPVEALAHLTNDAPNRSDRSSASAKPVALGQQDTRPPQARAAVHAAMLFFVCFL
jgi:hypothetical protein